ncbi:MAG: M24 family metallopeptidase, partial [Armatimonadetes bacterium]|nr:M24 family metallopeptidase [Armatimonadota bacterium]
MLTAEGCLKRRERLWQSLDLKPDWIVLSEPQHLIYFANFAPSPFTYATQNASAVLLLGADGSSILVADNLQGEFAKKAHVDRVESFEWYSQRQKVETFDVSSVIHTLKRSKDPDEVAILRRCMRSAEAGFSAAIRNIKPGMTELQAYELVASAVMEEAQDRVIVYGDFVTGPHAFGGGGRPTLLVIEKDDFILLDFSVIIHGYRGDFANTFVVDGGKANSRQHEMASVCFEGMATGEKLLQAGTACNELDAAIRNVYKQHGVQEYFQHHAGHGLGLGHPDAPYIVPESTDILVEGDV